MNDTAVAVLSANEVLAGLKTVQSVLAPDLSPEELRLFAMVATRSGLDPFAKQIYAVKRKGRVTFQTGIDGYRSIAARTGMYDGQDEPEFGPVCTCGEKPEGHPESATVRVYRKGVGRAIAATAHWHEYKPGDNDFMWVRMPRVMIGKVAEALALRKAFPYDPERRQGIGADVYTADEMAQAERPEASQPVAQPTLAERAAAKVAEIDTTPPKGPDAAGVASPEPTAEPSAPGLSREEFAAGLQTAGISAEFALERAKVLFPGVDAKALTAEQRAELLDDLTAPDTLPFLPEEEAELDAAASAV